MYTLNKDINRFRFLFLACFYFSIPVAAIILLYGCGENKAIIPASRLTSGQVTLSWNDVPQAVAYDVHLSTTPGVTALNAFKISDVTSPITITDLEPGTTYYFIVIAVGESGQGENSNEIAYTAGPSPGNIHFNDLTTPVPLPTEQKTATVPAEQKATTVPAEQKTTTVNAGTVSAGAVNSKEARKQSTPEQPASAVGSGKVTLAWDNVANANSYNIYWSNKKGATKRNGTRISDVKNPHTITGLKKGSTYYFVVTAVNESGESAVSESISYTVD
jgi:fibronectin type 3 domain-containing protein